MFPRRTGRVLPRRESGREAHVRERTRKQGGASDGKAPDGRAKAQADWAQEAGGQPVRRRLTTGTFVLADAVAFALAGGGAYLVAAQRVLLTSEAAYGLLFGLFPLLAAVYIVSGLYRAVLLHPAEELRRVSLTTAVVALSSVAAALLAGLSSTAVAAGALAGGAAMVTVPVCRALSRVCFARQSWWGAPVVVLSRGGAGVDVVDTLRRWPELGLRPVALPRDGVRNGPGDAAAEGTCGDGAPAGILHDVVDVSITEGIDRAPVLAARGEAPYAVVAMKGLNAREVAVLVDRYSRFFRRVFVVPDVSSVQALWTTADGCGGLLGFGVQHDTHCRGARLVRRIFNTAAAVALGLLLAPVLVTIAVLIKLDSRGPVFFRQRRMGREGRCFDVLKFRTMHTDAETRLQELLDAHPELREQYRIYHKLADDPRVTRMGRWLRRYSVDELPQVWNVLRGEMALVGPRAYLPAELPNMNGLARVVLQSAPGMTGLWQVSGRNGLSFEERVDLDVHYTQNRSFWLDLYLLARTVPVVVSGEGAH